MVFKRLWSISDGQKQFFYSDFENVMVQGILILCPLIIVFPLHHISIYAEELLLNSIVLAIHQLFIVHNNFHGDPDKIVKKFYPPFTFSYPSFGIDTCSFNTRYNNLNQIIVKDIVKKLQIVL